MLKTVNLTTHYEVDTPALSDSFFQAIGKTASPGIVRFFESAIPLLELAHEAGAQGTPLDQVFPFLQEVAPA